jgi:murein L,D-transpeptidase YafK
LKLGTVNPMRVSATVVRFVVLVIAVAASTRSLRSDPPDAPKKADRIVIVKSARTLTLMSGTQVFKTYKVALGRQPTGPKEKAGDHKTPEGHYTIDSRNANSQFHRALHISYPNQLDREQSHRLGVNPGGGIEIHGVGSNYAWLGGLHRQLDWTDGCIAVTDEEIEEIWGLVPVGTPVEIRP